MPAKCGEYKNLAKERVCLLCPVNSFSLNANYSFQNNTLIIFWLKKSLRSAYVSSKIKLIMMHAMLQIPLHDIQRRIHSLYEDMTLKILWEKRPTPTSSQVVLQFWCERFIKAQRHLWAKLLIPHVAHAFSLWHFPMYITFLISVLQASLVKIFISYTIWDEIASLY